MTFDPFGKKQIAALTDRLVDAETALFEAQRFETIASDKLTLWVGKHDELLARYKQLAARFKKLHPTMKI